MLAARAITRRSLLAAAAGAAAGRLLRPGGAIAALSAPDALGSGADAVRFERWIGALSATATTVDLGRNADLVGVEWPAGMPATGLELRVGRGDGSFSRWVSAARHGHGPDLAPSAQRLSGDPVWTGGAVSLQLRAARPLSGVRLQLIDVSSGRGARRAALAGRPLAVQASLPLLTPTLAAGSGQPPIIARRGWARAISPPRVTPGYGAVEMAFVHHTENPNGYARAEVPAMLRAIYAFHRYVNGWNDIGYNFVIDSYGRIFEARAGGIDEPVVGAQAGGYNLVSTGVAVLGSFSDVPISAASRAALERLLAWKLSLHGVPAVGRVTVRVNPAGARYSRFPAGAHVSLPRVAGHRDGDSTDCPGAALYRELPAIRSRVLGLAGRPLRATLTLGTLAAGQPGAGQPGAGQPGAPPSPAGRAGVLTGGVSFLDGAPVAGATVQIQLRSVSEKGVVVAEQTVAQAPTGPDGRFSLAIAVSPASRRGTWLRALVSATATLPAAVSAPLQLPGAVSFTPQSAAAPTPSTAAPPAS